MSRFSIQRILPRCMFHLPHYVAGRWIGCVLVSVCLLASASPAQEHSVGKVVVPDFLETGTYAWMNPQGDSVPSNQDVEQHLQQAIGDTNWYDSKTDRAVPISVKESTEDSEHRTSRWLPRPKKIRSNRALPNVPTGTGPNISGAGNIIGWTIMGLLGIVLIGVLIYVFSKVETELEISSKGSGSKRERRFKEETLADRIEQLPAEVRQQGSDLRGEAERQMHAGNFQHAIICLFGHQLLQLDRQHLLRLTRGKTNHQYVRETSSHPQACEVLRETVATFEASYFGRHPISLQRFQFLWDQNLLLEKWLMERRERTT